MLNTFILFPSFNPISDSFRGINEITNDEGQLKSFLIQLERILETVGQEKDTDIFYNSEEIKAFLNDLEEDIEELYLINPAAIINEYLEKVNAINWQNNKKQSSKNRYFLLDLKAFSITELEDHSLGEGVAFEKIENNDKCLILNHLALQLDSHYISIISEQRGVLVKRVLTNLSVVNSKDELSNWLLENRKKRRFNLSDKHGENGTLSWKNSNNNKVSLLECSKEDAQKLLSTAIGDNRIDERRLYNYDKKCNKFILFYFEGDNPQNQYHGFHIDIEESQKIPKSILQRLKELYNL